MQIIRSYATPRCEDSVPGAETLNPELERLALDLRAANPRRTAGAPGAWQSGLDWWDSGHPAVARLNGHIADAVDAIAEEYLATARGVAWDALEGRAWFTVYGPGDWAAPHSHGSADWAGTYFVSAGAPPPAFDPHDPPQGLAGGELWLMDPGAALPGHGEGPFRAGSEHVRIPPTPGRLHVWPGPLKHLVVPYLPAGWRDDPDGIPFRISYAFALRHRFAGEPGTAR